MVIQALIMRGQPAILADSYLLDDLVVAAKRAACPHRVALFPRLASFR